jgi:hypothetical protein
LGGASASTRRTPTFHTTHTHAHDGRGGEAVNQSLLLSHAARSAYSVRDLAAVVSSPQWREALLTQQTHRRGGIGHPVLGYRLLHHFSSSCSAHARENLPRANVVSSVQVVQGDALSLIGTLYSSSSVRQGRHQRTPSTVKHKNPQKLTSSGESSCKSVWCAWWKCSCAALPRVIHARQGQCLRGWHEAGTRLA